MFCQVLGHCLESTGRENWRIWCVRALLIHNSDFIPASLWREIPNESDMESSHAGSKAQSSASYTTTKTRLRSPSQEHGILPLKAKLSPWTLIRGDWRTSITIQLFSSVHCIDKSKIFLYRFIVLQGSSGFYTYGIYEHKEGWPDFGLGETRVAFKLRKDKSA